MKNFFWLCISIAALSSCKTQKTLSDKVSTVSKDSVIQKMADSLAHVRITDSATMIRLATIIQQLRSEKRTIIIHDTVISTGGLQTLDTIDMQKQAAYDAQGKRIPIQYGSTNGNLHSTITILPDGRIVVNCHEDSLQHIIRNLQYEKVEIIDSFVQQHSRDSLVNTQLRDSITHLQQAKQQTTHEQATDHERVVKTTKTWWGRNWWWLAIIVVVLIIELVYRFLKSKIP